MRKPGLFEMPYPATKFRGRILAAEYGFGNRDHGSACFQDRRRGAKGDSGRGTKDHIRARLLTEYADTLDSDWPLFGVLGSGFKYRSDREVVDWGIKDAWQKLVTSAEGADDPVGTNESPGLRGGKVSGIDVDPVKCRMVNQICPVIENQLHLSGRQRSAKDESIGKDLGVRTCLVAIFEQRHACVSQRRAEIAQEFLSMRSWNH